MEVITTTTTLADSLQLVASEENTNKIIENFNNDNNNSTDLILNFIKNISSSASGLLLNNSDGTNDTGIFHGLFKDASSAVVNEVTVRKDTVIFEEDPFLTDVWICLILILMAFMCIGYLCTCLLYHKFKRWKRQILEAERAVRTSFGDQYSYEESLPSYTIVTGLPSYDQAMEQLQQLRGIRKASLPKVPAYQVDDPFPNGGSRLTFARLSLGEILQFYKNDKTLPV